MKKGGVSLLVQVLTLPIFFGLFYIFKAELYYFAVKTAHGEFADLMMIRNNVFIPEYWAHITPRYILPVCLITILGASFSSLLWDKKFFAIGHFVLFLFWPKTEMSNVELAFTVAFTFSIILLSCITPAFSTSIINCQREKLAQRKKIAATPEKSKVFNS